MDEAEKSRATERVTLVQSRTASLTHIMPPRRQDTMQSISGDTIGKDQVNATITPCNGVKLSTIDSQGSQESWTSADERCTRYREMIQVSYRPLLLVVGVSVTP
jgi:hypothetical protein